MKARASERCESSRRRFSPRSKLEEEKLPRPRLEIIFQKNISTWISGEHEAGDDEEQEQLDRVHEEDTGDQRGEGEEDGEGRRRGIAEESKQEAGK